MDGELRYENQCIFRRKILNGSDRGVKGVEKIVFYSKYVDLSI